MNNAKVLAIVGCLAWGGHSSLGHSAETRTVVIPSATVREVSSDIASSFRNPRIRVLEVKPEQVVVMAIIDINPKKFENGACDQLPHCQMGQKVIFTLQQSGSDVIVIPKSQSVIFPGTTKEKSSEVISDVTPSILAGLESLKTQYQTRAGKGPATLGSLVRSLPKGTPKSEIIEKLGKPALETKGADGKVFVAYEEKPTNVPPNVVGTIKGDECLLTFVEEQLSDSMCLSGMFSK